VKLESGIRCASGELTAGSLTDGMMMTSSSATPSLAVVSCSSCNDGGTGGR
jgi:hypothetical protein